MVTGPALTDDQVLGIITSILGSSGLQQSSRLTFEEFTNVGNGSFFHSQKHPSSDFLLWKKNTKTRKK